MRRSCSSAASASHSAMAGSVAAMARSRAPLAPCAGDSPRPQSGPVGCRSSAARRGSPHSASPAGEETAAGGEGQQVADLRPVPGAGGHPLGENPVEQMAAGRRQRARAQVALRRQHPGLGEFAGLLQVAAVVAEALRAEIVGHAVRGDSAQALVEGGVIRLQCRQPQGEAVGRMRAALQLAAVTHLPEHRERRILRTRQVGIGLARQVQAEPLPRERLAVLETGIADRPQRHARRAGQAARGLLGVEFALLDPQPEVLAGPERGMSSTSSTWKSSATAFSVARPRGSPQAVGPSSSASVIGRPAGRPHVPRCPPRVRRSPVVRWWSP